MNAPLIVLGITGSIAAYKAADLASQLVKGGADVHVVMTAHACDFITPLTMQTLSRNPVVTASWNAQTNWKPGHIDLADRADLLLIAPATADLIAELAHGLASHPLAEIALATLAPLLIAPAMNGKMWGHPATQANVGLLTKRGAEFIGPAEGQLACGYEGLGRLADVGEIAALALSKVRISKTSQDENLRTNLPPQRSTSPRGTAIPHAGSVEHCIPVFRPNERLPQNIVSII